MRENNPCLTGETLPLSFIAIAQVQFWVLSPVSEPELKKESRDFLFVPMRELRKKGTGFTKLTVGPWKWESLWTGKQSVF